MMDDLGSRLVVFRNPLFDKVPIRMWERFFTDQHSDGERFFSLTILLDMMLLISAEKLVLEPFPGQRVRRLNCDEQS